MTYSFITTSVVLGAALALSACGETRMEHMQSGALMGAGAGLVVGAVAAPTLLTAGLVGAGVGAVAGAVTPNQCSMGKWGMGY